MSFTSSKGSQGSECSALQQEKLAREQWDSPVSRELRERGGVGRPLNSFFLLSLIRLSDLRKGWTQSLKPDKQDVHRPSPTGHSAPGLQVCDLTIFTYSDILLTH